MKTETLHSLKVDRALSQKTVFSDEQAARLLAEIEKSTGKKIVIAHINPEKAIRKIYRKGEIARRKEAEKYGVAV
jgi:hypothetical protein